MKKLKKLKTLKFFFINQYLQEADKNKENEKQILKFESENSDLQKKLDDHSKKLYDISNKTVQFKKSEEKIKKLNNYINKCKDMKRKKRN